MWSYYGAKTNIIDRYPPPKYGKIIEPFAGTARYALKYHDRDVILIDKYEAITQIWLWLQQCSPKDIQSLPRLRPGDDLDSIEYDCKAQRLLMGFLAGFGLTHPANKVSPHRGVRPNAINHSINFIASNLWKIKHWKIQNGNYSAVRNQKATWFIDPPYEVGGQSYKESGRKIDYNKLAKWCLSRSGQVIICENTSASWMDFKPFFSQRVLRGPHAEAIWSNLPTAFDNEQLKIDYNNTT